jgi:hypothetical protein
MVALRDLFSKRRASEVIGTKVLVCGLHPKFAELLDVDSAIYSRFYPATLVRRFSKIEELLEALDQRYDVVHLFGDVSPDGTLIDADGNALASTLVIKKCCASDVKLLWVANDNKAEGYIKGFKTDGQRINLVMTTSRNGAKFAAFLEKLLSKMSRGETMPEAWATLVPQAPGPWQQDLPGCIFAAFRGG